MTIALTLTVSWRYMGAFGNLHFKAAICTSFLDHAMTLLYNKNPPRQVLHRKMYMASTCYFQKIFLNQKDCDFVSEVFIFAERNNRTSASKARGSMHLLHMEIFVALVVNCRRKMIERDLNIFWNTSLRIKKEGRAE